jgi:hypothetical protein
MIRLNYSFVAKTPIFTGSDENNGTTRQLRREKRLLPQRATIESRFIDRKARQTAALNILYSVYKEIDNSLKSNYGYYDAFANKAKAATQCPDKYAFLNQLCESCGVVTISDRYADTVMVTIEMFEDAELLETIRNEHQFLMLRLREAVKQEYTPSVKNLTGTSNFSFTKSFDKIPYVGGNSIRGLMRRLLMYDYLQQLGIVSMEKEMYHRLFTGGTLSDSSGVEDMVLRRGLTELCPPIALLGSAIGSQTVEGALKVIGARLRCIENGTGDVSFWELIETQFGTRLDSEKQESKLQLIGSSEKAKSGKGKDISVQMKYEYECFITGSAFDSAFVIDTHSPIVESCFYRAIELFRQYGFVGGNSARDSGSIDIAVNIPADGSKLYLDYLQSIKEKAFNHFQKQLPQ